MKREINSPIGRTSDLDKKTSGENFLKAPDSKKEAEKRAYMEKQKQKMKARREEQERKNKKMFDGDDEEEGLNWNEMFLQEQMVGEPQQIP